MDVEMSESESVQGEKKMECEIENQLKISREFFEKKMDDKDVNVSELLNIILDIVDFYLDILIDFVDDGLINEIVKKVENEDRMIFCIEKFIELMIFVISFGQILEFLVVYLVCVFVRFVDMEYVLVEENDVGLELVKEV